MSITILQDAEQAGNQDLAQFFLEVQGTNQQLANWGRQARKEHIWRLEKRAGRLARA